jgi:hypothetical protein
VTCAKSDAEVAEVTGEVGVVVMGILGKFSVFSFQFSVFSVQFSVFRKEHG